MKRIGLTILPALMLAACGDSGGADADGDGVISQDEMRAEMAGGSQVTMRPGKWEQKLTISEFDIPGMPEEMKGMMAGSTGTGFTIETCLTEDQVSEPDADWFGGEGQNDCTYEEFDRSGNTMTIRMTCKTGDGGTAKIAMDGEFGADSYSLSMDNQITGVPGMPGEGMTMRGRMEAQRIGDCDG